MLKKFNEFINEDYDFDLGNYELSFSNTSKELDIDLEDAYEIFKKSYSKSTGQSWDKDKFMYRAYNWTFYGEEDGFVAVRHQRSGAIKLVGMAGNPRSIMKGMNDVIDEGGPIWGMMDKRFVDILVKRYKFVSPPSYIIKVLIKFIPKSVFGGVDFVVNNDGSVTLDYEDVGKATKYFVANREYYREYLTKNMGSLGKVPQFVIKKFVKSI